MPTSQVELQEIPAFTGVALRKTMTLKQIADFAGEALPVIHDDMKRLDLHCAGPAVFIYYGADGSADTEFELVVVQPVVAAGGALERCEYYHASAFKCATLEYVGPMSGIGEGWHQLVAAVHAQGRHPSVECREVYDHWVALDSDENVTTLQMGYL
ncbi:hypothetical protein WH50_21795 [Pokkaliibacter plantistimulans]|uniref:Bacterial transcription activator effector binding domain-containing protein n=1 Tax=Pokkaliibacter plantistimulans TaxID=1635171 RepID=A0ABX5LRI2_9GAMM|nr:GyrI-like domain-containing protein [Pokkaliibacter plantistimulans]PXF29254.1 hypothetical protein WH50_21795 [Pokkaliibacter plantistimulans]